MNVSLLALLALTATSATDPRDGRELLAQMRRTRSYSSLTFVQTTKLTGRADQTWYESIQSPGKLRIDIAPLDSQRVAIFRNDSIYSQRGGRTVRSGPYVHSLMILLTDVYTTPAESSASRLSTLGYDLGKIRADTWDGRRVWVVGAVAGDTTSNQFWIDAERMYMVRMIERQQGPNGTSATLDSRVTNHQRFGNFWVETEMVFLENGEERQREVYNNITVNPTLDQAIFDPSRYSRPAWIPSAPQP